MLLRKIEDGIRKQRIIGTLAVCNARETMLQKIGQEGILVSRCLHCLLDFSRPFFAGSAMQQVKYTPSAHAAHRTD